MSKAKTLKRGDAWTTKDRLWAVVDAYGELYLCTNYSGGVSAAIFKSRKEAIVFAAIGDIGGDRVVRLSDLSGIVQ